MRIEAKEVVSRPTLIYGIESPSLSELKLNYIDFHAQEANAYDGVNKDMQPCYIELTGSEYGTNKVTMGFGVYLDRSSVRRISDELIRLLAETRSR